MDQVLLVVSTYKQQAENLAKEISKFLKERSFKTQIYYYDGFTHSACLEEDYKFAISLGGDGTVLFTARYCAPRNIPVFPVNLGEFGFIANIQPENWKEELENYILGEYKSHTRTLLRTCVVREGKKVSCYDALNDIVISGSGIAKLIKLDVFFNDISFGTYRADGIIISTPTGSTAYSAASGGPILDPNLFAFVLTPIAAFSFSNRPVVLPSSGELSIKILPLRQNNIILSVDGQELFALQEGDEILVSESPASVILIGCTPLDFYNALRSKLGWSGSFNYTGK